MEEKIGMQTLKYFTEGNSYAGSLTKDWEKPVLLRYLVRPEKKEALLLVWCWREDVCFEKAGEKEEARFPLDDDGIEQTIAWLQERYNSL